MIARVVLIGFSATGKSTVGRLASALLGWHLVDVDAEIERREGVLIPEIFAGRGEAAFRAIERAVLLDVLGHERVIVATGGGAVCDDTIWEYLHDDRTLTIRLAAEPEEILARLKGHAAKASPGETTKRPMLDAPDPLARIRELLALREAYYQRARITIPVSRRSPERTAEDVAELVRISGGAPSEITLDVPNASSRILVGPGSRDGIPSLLPDRWPRAARLWVAADANMRPDHTGWFETLGAMSGFSISVHDVPSGEGSKSLAGLSDLYDWMIEGGVERSDVAMAAGGGVVGDLMGFAASTVLRGVGLMQVPTTLLSMVDSSVGGKTGINHPAGKNLIGTFYQPSVVVVDTQFLASLPPRELRSGFAEMIKHGVIQASTPGGEDGVLLDMLEANVAALTRLDEPLASWVIRQNVSLKAAVVAEDEKEARLRAILNFGHTIGHGVEAAGYALLHGEAVAVGMVAAGSIAEDMGLVEPAFRQRLVRIIEAFGLPTHAAVGPARVREKMARDKKKSGGKQQWILPRREGGVEIRTDVREAEIDAAIAAVSC